MEALKNYGGHWIGELLAKDPVAIFCALLLLVLGSLLTSAGTKLGGRGVFALAKLAWSGIRWLWKPAPMSELASALLHTMHKNEPVNPEGHTVWYSSKPGEGLHFFRQEIYIDGTRINDLLTRPERKRILRAAEFDRLLLARRKVWSLGSGPSPLGAVESVAVDLT